jgi:hypothetical protein
MEYPDKLFAHYILDFPAQTRRQARKLFRRAIRDYFVMRRHYVIEPEDGDRVQSVLVGEVIQRQKTQRRKVKRLFTGRKTAGRPKRPEIKLLVARLFILWGSYANTPATFSRKSVDALPTRFEDFMHDLLPKLGASDVRRYMEDHWRERK